MQLSSEANAMAEAEDVITDAARHATVFARALWRRHRTTGQLQARLTLRDVSQRIDLLTTAVFGSSYPIRIAQAPAPPTFLTKLFKRHELPRVQSAIPATDGICIWLPLELPIDDSALALERYRVLMLQQAMRARRGSVHGLAALTSNLQRSIYTVLEAQAADAAIVQLLPGTREDLETLRASALQARPPLQAFPPHRQALEKWIRTLLGSAIGRPPQPTPALSAQMVRSIEAELKAGSSERRALEQSLFMDLWTGELRLPPPPQELLSSAEPNQDQASATPRSARLPRRPESRETKEDEDEQAEPGAWMIQTTQPHEQAEDPTGLQRPTDRDESTAAEEFADALSELPEARLISTPGRPKEVLLSDDAPTARAKRHAPSPSGKEARFQYPEWDYRAAGYRAAGATVRQLAPGQGPQEWVEHTLARYRSMLDLVRRRFELLRAQRVRVRQQLDGEEIDLEAYIDSYANFRAGLPMAQALYQSTRPVERNLAIMLLIDISGSTDAWISADKRVIDVEREALLLVSIALQGMAEPYSILAFSGEGPHGVTVRPVKTFDEAYSHDIARRIAALEPEHYTRAGAAIRHATAALMQQAARHRLLLLLSDGKPNDIDDYEARYGVEDMRQAITEARLQGVNPFCLTIDRQAANYLPAIFGVQHYALLPKPELLPTVLLEWMKRLVTA
jgi:nitric oxide reductase NorD protein